MLRFQHIEYLWLLLVLPVMIAVFYFYKRWQKKSRNKFAEQQLQRDVAGSISKNKMTWKFILLCLSVLCMIIALANPQIGNKMEEVKSKGIDIMVALDVSNSMKAEDVHPSRLKRAKLIIERLIDKLHGDRIGIVVFAGDAYVQLPITSDYSAAKLFLPSINTDIVPVQGTAIGRAINLCVSSFSKKSKSGKAIILISDGEDHDKDAMDAAENAADKDINIYTIGMGSVNGGPIPIYKNGVKMGYQKDKKGNTVVTKLDPEMLKEIASRGNGSFVRADDSRSGLSFILNKVSKLKSAAHKTHVYKSFQSRFQIFIALSILFSLSTLLLSTKKAAWINRIQLFKEPKKDA